MAKEERPKTAATLTIIVAYETNDQGDFLESAKSVVQEAMGGGTIVEAKLVIHKDQTIDLQNPY